MLFNSIEFIFCFLPITLLVFVILGRFQRPLLSVIWLIGASLFFYAWMDWKLLGLLLSSIVLNYAVGDLLHRHRKRWLLLLAVGGNLAVLGYFKYAFSLLGVLDNLFGTGFTIEKLALPLGISFFTFQQISYLVDIYRGIKPAESFIKFMLFVAFFPHLIAGPLLHHAEMLRQFHRPETFVPRYENIAVGLVLFTIGLGKKVLFGDTVKAVPNAVFAAATYGDPISVVSAWMATLGFCLQLYFDFSGYSDMAIGLARMFGVSLPVNFDSPLKCRNIRDLWQRWHMSLSRFLSAYVYIPLVQAVMRGRTARGLPATAKVINQPGPFLSMLAMPTVLTMFLAGIWHGAGMQFAIFGVIHGLMLVIDHGWRTFLPRAAKAVDGNRLGRAACHALTLTTFVATLVFIRNEGLDAGLTVLRAMVGEHGLYLPESYLARLGAIGSGLAALGVHFGTAVDVSIYPNRDQMLIILGLTAVALWAPNSHQIVGRFKPYLNFRAETVPAWMQRIQWRPGVVSGVLVSLILVMVTIRILGQADAFFYFQF